MAKKLRIDYHETPEDAIRMGAKVFLPMLSMPYADAPEITEGYSQPKFDGIRSVMRRDPLTGRPGAFSRGGKEQFTVPHIVEELEKFMKGTWTADGELYGHALSRDFNKITSLVRKQKPSAADINAVERQLKYHIYDCYVPGLEFKDRYRILQEMFALNNFKHLVLARTDYFTTADQRDALYAEYLADNYEGQILRRSDGLYMMDTRPNSCVKRKEFITEEFTIKRLEEGVGNWAGAVAFVCVELENGEECETGIRGDYATRAQMLREKDEYVDGTATVRYLNRTPDNQLRGGVTIDAVKGQRED